MSSLLHEKENNEWSENFLKSNGEKFKADCVKVLKLLYTGIRLTGKQVNDTTGMADGGRRLREIYAARKDCKKGIRMKKEGGLEGVEYWLEIPLPPTKAKAIAEGQKILDMMNKPNAVQQNLF